MVLMKDCQTRVAFGFEDNAQVKRERLAQLVQGNKTDSLDSNFHSTLKIGSQSADNPSGEVSLANAIARTNGLLLNTALFAKKVR